MLAKFAVRFFGGKFAAMVNSLIVMLVMHSFAYLADRCPAIAATVDPQAVAGFLDAVLFATVNAITNGRHGDVIEALQAEVKILAANPTQIPVRRAEPVHPQ